jgi:hypothetical protein
MIAKNPYITGNPVGNGYAFIGRTDILKAVLNVLIHPEDNAIVLVGQRRIGKTSVLHELNANLPENGDFQPIYFDLQDKSQWPLEELLQALANKISDEENRPDLDNEAENTFHHWLQQLLNDLPEEKSLVLLFDEFDVIDDSGNQQQAGKSFFPYLRQLLDIDHQRLNFVFVTGRKINDLSQIFLELFKGIINKKVSLLDHDETIEIIRLSEKNQTLNWEKDATERIWQLTNGHPYLTQHLSSRIWDNLIYDRPSGKKVLTATLKDVEKELKSGDILKASENTLEWLWGALPPAERVIASLLANVGGAKSMNDQQLKVLLQKKGLQVITSDLRDAPQKLIEWDLIETVEKERYCFRVELLREWVALYKPINQLQKELEQIKSSADYFYALAKVAYEKKKVDKAVSFLNQAIKTTPNHLEANLLFTDILLSQGEDEQARQKLEKIYTEQPDSDEVRYKLAQLLLTCAKNLRNKDDKEPYAFYERVLALESNLGEIVKWAEWERIFKRLAHQEDYDTGLKLALNLSQKYTKNHSNWQDEIAQLRKKQLYHSAIKAIKNDDKESALSQLKSLISLTPNYKEASRYLYLADTGYDPIQLKNSRRRYRLALTFMFILVIVGIGGLFWHTEPLPFLPETYMLKEKEATYKLAEQRLAKIESERETFNRQLTEVRASEQALTKQVAQLEGQTNQLKEQTKQLKRQLSQVDSSKQMLSKQITLLDSERNQLKREREQLSKQLDEVRLSEQSLTKQVAQLAVLQGENEQLNSQLIDAKKLIEERKGSIKSFLFSGDYIVIVGTYGSEKAAEAELSRIRNELKKYKDDFPKLTPKIVHNERTQVWFLKIDEAAYSRESAEMLKLWAIEKLKIQGAYILRRVKKTY